MAVATSPYQNNDYQSANTFRPARLPINDIFKGLAAQNLFWEQGAARVKNVYENALNLNLTLAENRELRDNYLKEAEKQMSKLSTQNLSDPSVQRQGISLFDNLLRDPGVVQDDYLTKRQRSILSEAEKHKNDVKSKGAGFHMDNLNYALRPFKEFSEKTSRSQLDNIFQKAKDSAYIPYYDVGKERLEILEKCKGNKIVGTVPDGPYLEGSSDKSLYQSKLYGCLEGGMSDYARQQIRISGAARYNDDYNALRNDYISVAQEKKEYYDSEKAELLAKLAALQKTSPNDPQIAEIDAMIKNYDDGLKKINTDLGTYHTWDEKYMSDNYEDLAQQAYHKISNGSFAAAFAFQDIEKSIKENAVWITTFTQNEINRRTLAGFQHDERMENLEFQHKLLTGKDKDGNSIDVITSLKAHIAGNPNADFGSFMTQATEAEGTTSSQLLKQIETANNFEKSTVAEIIRAAQSNPDLSDAVAQLGVRPDSYTGDQYKNLWRTINSYVATALAKDPNDATALKFKDAHNILVKNGNTRTMWKAIYDDAKETAIAKNPQVFQNHDKITTEILTKVKAKGNIPADRVKQIILGGDPDYEVKWDTPNPFVTDVSGKEGAKIIDRRTGKIISDIPEADAYKRALQGRNADFGKILDQTLSENTVMQRMGLSTGNLFTKGSVANRDMETWFGNSLGRIGEDVIFNAVGPLDPVTGKVRIQATNKDGERISASDMKSAIAEQGKGVAPENLNYKMVDDNTLEINLPSAAGLVSVPTYGETLKELINYVNRKAQANPNLIPAVGITKQVGRSPQGMSFSLRVSKKIGSNDLDYTIISGNKEMAVPRLSGNPVEDAINTLNKLLNGELNK